MSKIKIEVTLSARENGHTKTVYVYGDNVEKSVRNVASDYRRSGWTVCDYRVATKHSDKKRI